MCSIYLEQMVERFLRNEETFAIIKFAETFYQIPL